jgi:quercetin dioxygenase-like cupin family protein
MEIASRVVYFGLSTVGVMSVIPTVKGGAPMTRVLTLSVLVLVGLASVVWSQAAQPAAPQPNPENFTGKVAGHPTADIRMLRYSFEPGARTDWHSHEGGQVILIEKGRLRVQEAGSAVREIGPRESFVTAPGVKHWHGAVPGEGLTQVSLSFGMTNWMEEVTDAQYAAGARK